MNASAEYAAYFRAYHWPEQDDAAPVSMQEFAYVVSWSGTRATHMYALECTTMRLKKLNQMLAKDVARREN